MEKNLFLAALAFIALVSCTSDEFVGDNTPPTTSNTAGAIQFTSNAPRITRAAGTEADAKTLGYSFNVYATKTVTENNSDVTSNVFALNAIGSPDGTTGNHTPYQVWYTDNSANNTSSNTSNWEYVGDARTSGDNPTNIQYGKGNITLSGDQTIKYWDYSAKQYDFVAYKATVETVENEEKKPKITNYTTTGFTVEATAAQLAGLYVADKVTLKSTGDNPDVDNNPTKPATSINKIGGIVQFTFRSAAAKVRLGIYETIPGYDVKNVSFRPNGTITDFTSASTTNAKLSGSFNGTSSSGSGTYTVRYNSATGIAEFTTSTTASQYFDFGSFASASTALGESSITPMWATGSSAYQSVFPNTDHVANMVLYVDYDLCNSVSGETIHVKGAKAVVPAMYMTWNPNYAYTYLFKISDNTNGTTGTENTSPEGLYPITFDALTIAATGEEVGTITTVSTPAITTYQKGSVSDAGITYATASTTEPIYITVNTDGTLAELSANNIKLYTVTSGTTEADLILTSKTKTLVTGVDALEIPSSGSGETKQGITFTVGKYAKFTPAAGTIYAVEYLTATAVTGLTVGTSVVTGYYTYTDDNGYVKITTEDTKAADNTTYYNVVPQYKIIEVAAASGGGNG